MSVLIIEDDVQTAEYLKSTIEKLFNEVFIANDGERGLELFFEKKPDILFVDIMMPKINGLNLIREIRKTDKEVKIAIITSHNSNEYLKEAVKLKLEDYLIKPVGFQDFLLLLNNLKEEFASKYPLEIALESGAKFYPYDKAVLFEKTYYNLTRSENKLLELLFSHRDQIVSKEVIEACLYYGGAMSDSALKGLVNKLRQKIGKNSIQSQSGYGYKILIS